MPGYSLSTAPPELSGFLDELVAALRAEFAQVLVGVVLHGSLAMGCFYPPKSDIDLLILVTDLDDGARHALYDRLARHNRRRPYAAGLEVSVLRADDALRPVYPIPFLVHFGDNTSGPQIPLRNGGLPRDPDLAGHFVVARARGVSLLGPPPDEVIGEPIWGDYLASVRADLAACLEGEAIVAAPRYAVLNLCRWAMMQSTKTRFPPSKEEAAVWALSSLPAALHPVIAQALAAYRSDLPVRGDMARAGGPWDPLQLLAFRDWALTLPAL